MECLVAKGVNFLTAIAMDCFVAIAINFWSI